MATAGSTHPYGPTQPPTPRAVRRHRLLLAALVGTAALATAGCQINYEIWAEIYPGAEQLDYSMGMTMDDDAAALDADSDLVAAVAGPDAAAGVERLQAMGLFEEREAVVDDDLLAEFGLSRELLRDMASTHLSRQLLGEDAQTGELAAAMVRGDLDLAGALSAQAQEGDPAAEELLGLVEEGAVAVQPLAEDDMHGERITFAGVPTDRAAAQELFNDTHPIVVRTGDEPFDFSTFPLVAIDGGQVRVSVPGYADEVADQVMVPGLSVSYVLVVPGAVSETNADGERDIDGGTELVWNGPQTDDPFVVYTEQGALAGWVWPATGGAAVLLTVAALAFWWLRRDPGIDTPYGQQPEAGRTVPGGVGPHGTTTPATSPPAGTAQPAAPDAPPPGWYADPGGHGPWRWWDGHQWTAHTSGG